VQVIAPHLAQAVWASKRHDASHAQGARAAAASSSELRLVSAR
jgi:hypothetical protein